MANIKTWIVTGDTHGRVEERLRQIAAAYPDLKPTETGVIILGDVGLNYYLNDKEKKVKRDLHRIGFQLYCLRGNHEERPDNLINMVRTYDSNVGGEILVEQGYPLIKYFLDGGEYIIDGYSVLTIGGAYSVDKNYRLERAKLLGDSFTGWFPDEQLTPGERRGILEAIKGKEFHYVFTHTCPLELEPTDLFLPMIDQSTVDNSMEKWLTKVRKAVKYDVWLWGHFHDDRKIGYKHYMLYKSFAPLESFMPKKKRHK